MSRVRDRKENVRSMGHSPIRSRYQALTHQLQQSFYLKKKINDIF